MTETIDVDETAKKTFLDLIKSAGGKAQELAGDGLEFAKGQAEAALEAFNNIENPKVKAAIVIGGATVAAAGTALTIKAIKNRGDDNLEAANEQLPPSMAQSSQVASQGAGMGM